MQLLNDAGSWPRSVRCQIVVLALIFAAAIALRGWGLSAAPTIWHPDEIFLVAYPLHFFSGDLNPHSFHKPTLHFYVLGLAYGGSFIWQLLSGSTASLAEFLASCYFWADESPLFMARLVNVGFALGTVCLAYLIALRLYGSTAALTAAFLLCISPLHVRQSPIAAVDMHMTFWFAAALLTALAIGRSQRYRHYALAGLFAGLAASAKYPGAAAGVTVLAAHLGAGQSLWDRRLALTITTAILAFAATSPYAILDAPAFFEDFLFQFGHARAGRSDQPTAAWFHLSTTLRYSFGLLGHIGGGLGLLYAMAHWRRGGGVIVVGFFGFLVAVGWGQLAFIRYGLPLMLVQAIAIAGLVSAFRLRRGLVLLLLLACEPLYSAVRIADIQASTDTRTRARFWIEEQLPEGSICCNVGGWAGDVPLRTIESLWWKIKHFEGAFGRAQMDQLLPILISTFPKDRFYSYAIHDGNRSLEKGTAEAAERLDCAYAIVHRHSLAYSSIDRKFERALTKTGRMLKRISPQGAAASSPIYDENDAYYVPIGGFGSLRESGPEVEIWALDSGDPAGEWSPQRIFARAYVRGAATLLGETRVVDALALCRRALQLYDEDPDAFLLLGDLYREQRRPDDAIGFYRQALALDDSKPAVWLGLAAALMDLERRDEAASCFRRVLQLDPEHPERSRIEAALSGLN